MIELLLLSKMKYILRRHGISCFLLALFLFGSVSGAETPDLKEAQKAVPKGPKLSIAEPNFDAGPVAVNEKATHIFKISNIGDEVLHIKDIKTG